ncbi:PLP-dependent aspartate aminotransferase family protein [Sphingobacterium sp. lm-10]|uniref:trans-sulfuration enzyme family protein n=1 Tax=Sphingobacterium sp. lm-10 TaxID=2944904 RepID=UPI002020418F|nr:PLP-dependent aspartate aminotransferase family protein [Sphingobacterium sp. lm-10]MCL7988705.1 PLP-dependent aspartate aminotransferase family protein [Sphingobacterium sp. lm-10]
MRNLETDLIHKGEQYNETRAITPPIYQTATYIAGETIDEQLADATSTKSPFFYHRHGNPTNSQLGEILAKLEKTEDALLLATGMAAISTAVLTCVVAGDHVIAQHAHYAAAQVFFKEFLPAYGIEVTHVDQTDIANFEAAVQKNTKLIYVETPSNPNLEITDLEAVAQLARNNKIFTIVDNTFASPINQTPRDFGIDAVVHSATKYLGGHSDLTAGAICGSKEFIHQAWRKSLLLGASLSPMDSWLLLRGLKTLTLRIKQINENALELATWLEGQQGIKKVTYAGLPSHSQHALAKKQMHGFTGMLTIELSGDSEQIGYSNAQTVLKQLEIFANAVSLGGVESLVTHPASLWNSVQQREAGVKPLFPLGLLRISVGIEHIDDLKADLKQALLSLI